MQCTAHVYRLYFRHKENCFIYSANTHRRAYTQKYTNSKYTIWFTNIHIKQIPNYRFIIYLINGKYKFIHSSWYILLFSLSHARNSMLLRMLALTPTRKAIVCYHPPTNLPYKKQTYVCCTICAYSPLSILFLTNTKLRRVCVCLLNLSIYIKAPPLCQRQNAVCAVAMHKKFAICCCFCCATYTHTLL